MQFAWPTLSVTARGGVLTVRGWVQPSPITKAYEIEVFYRGPRKPIVRVLQPKLTRRPIAPDEPIPHTYGAGIPGEETPCLYYPPDVHDESGWPVSRPIATTIMPWLLAWLVDYELWHATGEWLGGGVPHGDGPKTEPDQEAPV
jgi:hypothetical protein